MHATDLERLLTLRVSVGYLGEKGQSDWWSSGFFGRHAATFIGPVFGSATRLAQFHGVTEAARRVHDVHIGVGRVFHLFRLPEATERNMLDALREPAWVGRMTLCTDTRDAAEAALAGLAGRTGEVRPGPVRVGSTDMIQSTDAVATLARLVRVEGQPFLRHLQDRLTKPQTKALAQSPHIFRPPWCCSTSRASRSPERRSPRSTVLYYKVLQYAGYSRNLRVAEFERKLKKNGRFAEFEAMFEEDTGQPWTDYQYDELVVDSLLPRIAHRLYPGLFRLGGCCAAAKLPHAHQAHVASLHQTPFKPDRTFRVHSGLPLLQSRLGRSVR